MQFGLFYEWPNPTLRQWKTLFEEGVEGCWFWRYGHRQDLQGSLGGAGPVRERGYRALGRRRA
jgi:hypothetical protein